MPLMERQGALFVAPRVGAKPEDPWMPWLGAAKGPRKPATRAGPRLPRGQTVLR